MIVAGWPGCGRHRTPSAVRARQAPLSGKTLSQAGSIVRVRPVGLCLEASSHLTKIAKVSEAGGIDRQPRDAL